MNKEEVLGFIIFKPFLNYFEAVVSSDVRTVHCEINVIVNVSESFKNFENCN